ncbi:hypothetical protein FHE66_14340 [Georgenia sp. 311]|uniref:ABC transporter permease n=1 Tax=Georgenia wutianyii TaxID=2585135 RepID=A0ABX5VKV1_9MICO|nr:MULTISPECIES: hypothetical protein [Georgenia]QDB78783.1 hypothetical protein FE251_04875 [Georgenia wutianyii]TNC16749.1 hypothetical protein FHE66_14340 [Georgenia sp. 311]
MSRTVAPPSRARARRPQWVRAADRHLRIYGFMWAWFWGICVAGIVVTTLVVLGVSGTVDFSVVQFVRQGPLVWFLMSIAILVATVYLGPHVANGMTRRSFVGGSLVAGVLAALLHAVTGTVLTLLEGVLYARMGWDHDATPGVEYTEGVWQTGLGPLLLDYSLAAAAGTIGGLLIGITYYRLGGWWGTFALPLTVLPVLYTMFATSWSEAPFVPWDVPPVAAVLAGGVLLVAAAIAFALLARTVPVKRSES